MTQTFDVPVTLFDKLTGLGELLLGTHLHKVLVKTGTIGKDEPLRGFKLLEAARDYLEDDRPETDQLAKTVECLRQVKSNLEHINRYLGGRKSCFCRELDDGEHSQQPVCSYCVLSTMGNHVEKALK